MRRDLKGAWADSVKHGVPGPEFELKGVPSGSLWNCLSFKWVPTGSWNRDINLIGCKGVQAPGVPRLVT